MEWSWDLAVKNGFFNDMGDIVYAVFMIIVAGVIMAMILDMFKSDVKDIRKKKKRKRR